MKRFGRVAILITAAVLALSSTAQPGPAASPEDQKVAKLVRDLQEQQAAITQNQAKIDEKLAAVAEAVRQARIFASRSGGR